MNNINVRNIDEDEWPLIGYFMYKMYRESKTHPKDTLEKLIKKAENGIKVLLVHYLNDGFDEEDISIGKELKKAILRLDFTDYISSDYISFSTILIMNRLGLIEKISEGKTYQRHIKFTERFNEIYNHISEIEDAYELIPINTSNIEEYILEKNIIIDSNELIKKIEKENVNIVISFDAKKIQNNKEMLIEYINDIVEIETGIYSLKQRYNNMIEQYKENISMLYPKQFDICLSINKELKKLDDKIDKLIKKKERNKPVFKEISYTIPSKPVFDLVKPVEPKYKTPNIFNKRKIEIINKELEEKYKEAVILYNEEVKKYQENMINYENTIKELKEKSINDSKLAYKTKIKEYEDIKKEIDKDINMIKKEKNNIKNNILKICEEKLKNEEKFKKNIDIEYEIKYIENYLKELIETREKLYACNVVYKKYRNLIAMSSFLDYLNSERCEKLSGNDGAYNLYEQESKSNIIISKMDIMIDKLEEIEDNQFTFYNKISETNNLLSTISDELLINNDLLEKEQNNTSIIKENVERIDYNTKVANYYNKVIASNTNAIKYMNLIGLIT